MKTPDSSRLVGAYGRHWRRDEVNWGTSRRWQMLGRVGSNRPGLRLCDFRYARGVYVLERRSRPTYVGIARGDSGFGSRLVLHDRDISKGGWTHFSWFGFDAVKDVGTRANPMPAGWAWLYERNQVRASQTNTKIEELEALLVGLLGSGLTNQRVPQFTAADEWLQVVRTNFGPGGICQRVDRTPFTESRWH